MPTCLPGTPFPAESLGPEQEPWLALLDGTPPDGDPLAVPPSTLVNRHWADLLEHAPDNWLTWYHRGVARWAAGRHDAAAEAWRASVSAAENPWALRCLAVTADSAQLYERALKLAPALEPLLVEAVAAGCRPELPPEPTGRLALLAAQARLALGDVEGARAIFDAGFEVANIREGETSLSDTWAALSSDPLPERYDFRMK
jgi:tetratricopeptide (TPR) repeat protein